MTNIQKIKGVIAYLLGCTIVFGFWYLLFTQPIILLYIVAVIAGSVLSAMAVFFLATFFYRLMN